MGRPRKNHALAPKTQGISSTLPIAYFDKLDRYCELTNQTKVAYIAEVVMRDLETKDLAALDGQEALPLSA